ncbi:MAG TPA: uroporphyrinogen-III C-methyltransferase [Planctomycetaceae bacterium]|nr:uroporphyrinogen-III C-methyltransferase [Planctomycetaceae bacterium]
MTTQPGIVYLVGAGPGDPGLLSLRGKECLERADMVLYDGLASPLLLRYTRADCERTSRLAGPDGKQLPQEEINRKLVDAAKQGKVVVRLKGGDPYIFGRGSEEAQALRASGIPFEVIPGVTAAVAAAEYAGISLTHRTHASAVAFITGHEDPAKADSSLDYDNLAHFPGTLVFYMGLHRLPSIVQRLLDAGKSAETPACVISRGTQTRQRTVEGTLANLPDKVTSAELHAPSLIVVGDCVTMREELAWFEDRPLFGTRIAIPRPLPQAYDTADLCIERGAWPVLTPAIAISPVDDFSEIDRTLESLEQYDWLIFTSRNGVEQFFARFFQLGNDVRRLGSLQLAAIGSATAGALAEFHLNADVIPESFRAEELAAALKDRVQGKHVLWLRANRGRDVLPTELGAIAESFQELVIYNNEDIAQLDAEVLEQFRNREIDWVALSSPSIARAMARLIPEEIRQTAEFKIATISPVTSEAARESGFTVNAEATSFTWPGILDAIQAFERQV